jgi:hypothetical protein
MLLAVLVGMLLVLFSVLVVCGTVWLYFRYERAVELLSQ